MDSLTQTESGYCCDECAGLTSPAIPLDDRFDFYECVTCQKVSLTGVDPWTALKETDPQDRMREIVLRLFVLRQLRCIDAQFDAVIPDFVTSQEKAPPFQAEIIIEQGRGDHPIVQTHPLFVKPHYTVCKTCSRKSSNYFTATVQIRGEPLSDASLYETILEDLQRFTEDLEKKNEQNFVNKVIEKPFGIDLQLSTYDFAILVANHVKQRYGAKLEESKHLMGRGGETGGELYRHTIAVRLLPFQKHYAILYDGELCIVRNFQSKFIHLYSLSRKLEFKIEVKYVFASPVQIIAKPADFLQFEVISDDQEFLHLTNPQNGATVTALKTDFEVIPSIGSMIYAVSYQEKLNFIPGHVYGSR